MNHFNRFIFSLLLTGVAFALVIILFADRNSAKNQADRLALERQRIRRVFLDQPLTDHAIQAEFAVKSVETAGDRSVSQTTILWAWRPYDLDPQFQNRPLPTQQFVLPGDRIAIDALVISPSRETLPPEADSILEYVDFHGINIAVLARLYPPDAKPADYIPLTPPDTVPMLFRHDPTRTGQVEASLWRHFSDLLKDPARAARAALDLRYSAPASCTIQPGYLYEVYVLQDPSAPAGHLVAIHPKDDAGEVMRLLHPTGPQTDKGDRIH